MDFTIKSIPLTEAARRQISLLVIDVFQQDDYVILKTDRGAFHGDDPATHLFYDEYKEFREKDTESSVFLTPWMLDDGLTHTVRVIHNTD